MFAPCFSAEFVKLRRAPILFAYVALPALSAAVGCANYLGNLGVLAPGWDSLWTQQTLFLCYFFLPALVACGASWLWRLEHQGSNWNALMSAPATPGAVFGAKLAVLALLDAAAFAAVLAFYVASGLALGVPGALPIATVAGQAALGWLGSVAIASIQLVVSMLVRNFAAPVGVGLGGGVLGLVATMGGAGYVFPYSLMQSGMNSNNLVVLDAAHAAQIAALSIAYTALACLLAARWLGKTDVHA